ncbi:MAG: ABC transporter permease [Bacteroides sp.]|nr:ABC transporter permease [Bacteroides sp.]
MIDLIREISQTLSHNKLRMSLTGFAVAWGIFMLIVLLSLAGGLVHSFESNMMTRNNNSLNVWGGWTTRAWHGLKEGRPIQLKERDAAAVEAEPTAPVKQVMTELRNDTVKFYGPVEVLTGGYVGVEPENQEFADLEIVTGRYINAIDNRERRHSLVIRDTEAERIFGSPENALGKTMRGQGLAWTVVGVYNHRWRSETYIPHSTAAALMGFSGDVNSLNVELTGVSTEEEGTRAEEAVRRALAEQHEFDPEDNNAVWINNRFNQSISAAQGMKILMYTMWAIGILTLLSGVVGVSNIMFVSVRERTHEIGIRRALGARPRNILLQIVLESVAITTIFGYIGIVLGTVVMGIINHVIGNSLEMLQNPTVDLATAFEVTGVLIVAGALAGLFPAIKATKVRPVEALRDE